MTVLGRRSFPAGKLRAIAGGAAALLLVAIGAFLWFRPRAPGVGEAAAAPRGTESDKSAGSDQGGPAPPSVPAREPGSSETRIAGPSAVGGAETSPAGPKADAVAQSKSAAAGASRRLRLLVPTYIYPAGEGRKEWLRLFDAAAKVEIVAIVNPDSGPGREQNIDYHATFTEANKLGIALLGYVSTDFGKRPQAEIRKDVDTWLAFYPQIRGFFFDQQPSEGDHAAQFAELRDYVKRKLPDPLVVTNPGVPCDEAYLAQNVSDVTCVFSNFQGFEPFDLPATFKPYDPSRFAAMPYNIPDAETMRTFLKEAIVKRIGYIYISDAKPPNPWGKLPAYWEAEVDAVSRLR
jgi:hypothetical protein